MRVALIDPSLFTLPYDAALASGLRSAGHEVTLHGRALRPNEAPVAGAEVRPSFYRASEALGWLPARLRLAAKGLDHLACMMLLQRRLRAERPDVIHFQWLPLPLLDRHLLAGFRRIAPVVLTVHDTDPFNGNPTAGVQRLGFTRLLAACDGLIVHTQQGLARLAALGLSSDRIAKLPHGRLAPASPTAAPDAMQGELTFVLFGKLKAYKGADLLISAFAALPDAERRQSRVRIIGQAYMDVAALRAQAAASGVADRVTIEDRFVADDEMVDVFAPGTIATFPYREIEASGVLSLALAHGRPVLASRIGNFGETIEEGVHGLLFPVGDVATLTDAMRRIIADRAFAARLARGVVALEAAQPGWEEIARMTVHSYTRAATTRVHSPVVHQVARGRRMSVQQQPKAAVLFRTHFWDAFAQRQFDRLLAVADGTDVFVLVDETSGPVSGIPHDRVVRVTENGLLAMGLARAGQGNLLWFNGDYPLYAFLAEHPDYDYVFNVEYDVVVLGQIRRMIDAAANRGADFVGLTKGDPFERWFWRDSCAGVYPIAASRHQLICLSLFSARALRRLRDRRLTMSRAFENAELKTWPYCEAFIPTELALAGMTCLELDDFGDTQAYDHWPPFLETDLADQREPGFIHPVLDPSRYVSSLLKYRVGIIGYLNPTSLFHRKLRRLPARNYIKALSTSFAAKVARTLSQPRKISA